MSTSKDVRISGSAEAERKIRQAVLDLKVLNYLNSTIVDRSLCGQALNQSVIFLEIAMGYRDYFEELDYKKVVTGVRDRGVIDLEIFSNLLDLLEIEKSKQEMLVSFWD